MRSKPVCAVFWADVEARRDAVVICFARSLKAEMRNPNLNKQGKQKYWIFKSSQVFLWVSKIPDHGCKGFLVCIAFRVDCVVNIKREYISSFHKWTTKQRVYWSHCQRTHYFLAQPVQIQREEKRRQDKDVSIRRKGNWERSIYLVQQSSSWVQRPGDPGTFPNSDRQLFVPHTWQVPLVKCAS